jgi:hypothetical protein
MQHQSGTGPIMGVRVEKAAVVRRASYDRLNAMAAVE